MKKRIAMIIVSGLVLSLILTGCAKESKSAPTDDNAYVNETDAASGLDSELEEYKLDELPEVPEEAEETDISEADYAQIAEELKEKYGTENVFQDVLIPQQFVLLTENQITGVLVLGELEQATTVPLDSVSDIKTSSIDSFVKVVITDIGGKEITVNLSPEDGDSLSHLMGR